MATTKSSLISDTDNTNASIRKSILLVINTSWFSIASIVTTLRDSIHKEWGQI